MRWGDFRQSTNVEDRSGAGGGFSGLGGGGIGQSYPGSCGDAPAVSAAPRDGDPPLARIHTPIGVCEDQIFMGSGRGGSAVWRSAAS